MKKISKWVKFVVAIGIIISGLTVTSVSATSNMEDASKIIPRLTLTAYGDTRSMGGGVKITPFIQYDSTSGQIQYYSVRATNLNGKTYRYNASYTNNRTAVNFTVTVYSKNIFGELDKALETQYWTVKSPGPRALDDNYRKQ